MDSATGAGDVNNTGLSMHLGVNNDITAPRFFSNAEFDNIRVWNIARSQEDIIDNANIVLTSVTNLIGSYVADQTSGDLVDLTGITGDGLLIGDPTYTLSTATLLDAFPPIFSSGFPFIDDITENDFQINSDANEAGLLFVAVYADGATPTVDDIVNGTGAETFASALSASVVTRIGGALSAGTDYDVYFVLEDFTSNRQLLPTLVEITTDDMSDVTPPVIAIDTPIEGDNFVNAGEALDVVIAGTTDAEDGQVVTVTFDDSINPIVQETGTVAGGVWTSDPADISILTDGSISISADVDDLAGNSATPATEAVTLDQTAPIMTVDSQLANDLSPEITGTIDDNSATIEVTVEGTNYPATNNADGTWTLPQGTIAPDLTEGTFNITANATDAAGNTGTDGSVDELEIDLTQPVISVDALITALSSPELTGTVDDLSASIDITVDGTNYVATNNGDGTWTLAAGLIDPPLVEGTFDVIAAATDDAGNVGSDATTDELEVDLTSPTITVDVIATNVVSPELTGTTDDNSASVEVTVEGTSYAATNNGDGTWTLAQGTIAPDLTEGVFEVTAEATDLAGNSGTDASTNEITIDLTSPTLTIDELITGIASPAISGSIDDLSASLSLEVDGNNYIPANNGDGTWFLSPGIIVPDLIEGTYDVVVTATDAVGNVGADATTDELEVDLTTPTITVDNLVTSITSPAVSGTVDDLAAVIDVTIDGTNYIATNSGDGSWMLAAGLISPPLGEGTYDVVAAATDAAGNVGADGTIDELTVSQNVISFDATGITSTSFVASWTQAEDVQNYTLDVSIASDFSSFVPGFEAVSVAADQTSFEVTGLNFSTTYHYRVRFTNTNAVESDNSNVVALKTIIDPETVADSLALVEILAAVNPQGLNWDTGARLRDWTGVTLDAASTRVAGIDISSSEATGDLPNPFSALVTADNGLSVLTAFNAADNDLTGLIDFSGTVIATLSVENNNLTFEDLEPLAGTTTFSYAPQADRTFVAETNPDFLKDFLTIEGNVRIVPEGDSYSLLSNLRGVANEYNWTREGVVISGERYTFAGSFLTINSIAQDNMGLFGLTVTNTDLPDLTLTFLPELIFATADVEIRLTDFSDALLDGSERFDAALLGINSEGGSYDTLEIATNTSSNFVFTDVILGDYLSGIDPQNREAFVPTYFGDAFEWVEADTAEIRSDVTLSIQMTEDPDPPLVGEGILDIVIEEDFGDDEEARVNTRRRAKRRKCGLRRRRTGGRQDDEFELYAYGETDDNGEFQFGFLPEGVYRFFVEYPGIPLDPDAEVQFEVGEQGISDTEFSLSAFASEEGVEVEITRILGVILTYFKDLEVYPNPSTDRLNIQYRHLKSTDVTAELVDLTGQEKWGQELQNGYNGNLTIDVSEYPAGIYILRFYDRNSRNENVVSYRVIVK